MMRWNTIETWSNGDPRTEVAQVPCGILFRTTHAIISDGRPSISVALQYVPCSTDEANAFCTVMSAVRSEGVRQITGEDAKRAAADIMRQMAQGKLTGVPKPSEPPLPAYSGKGKHPRKPKV